jgi:bla regulator protein BlaR1
MINLDSLVSAGWANALGWTFIHSLWQSLIVTMVLWVILRCMPRAQAQARYAVSAAALVVIVLAALITWTLSLPTPRNTDLVTVGFVWNTAATPGETSLTWMETVSRTVESNLGIMLGIWALGAAFFTFRLLAGWYYLARLRAHAIPVADSWNTLLQDLATKLAMTRPVTLAESAQVQAPIALGYLKPLILVPAGMLSGLTAEEVETILVHELAHIRRHDYLVNLIQLLLEAVFFFNPFVWIISNIIRREREHCCDDIVVTQHGNKLAYAYALTRLEEVRLTNTLFALSLAGNKNQLLNRIKRIMETSAKNYSYRNRVLPVVLLVVGLICASFLTIRVTHPEEKNNSVIVAGDTLKPKSKTKSASYSRKSVTTLDENGEPKEEITESFTGDEALAPFMAFSDADMFMAIPPMPPMPDFEAIPDFPDMPDLAMLGDMDMMLAPLAMMYGDTTRPGAFHWNHDGNWEEFSEAFEKSFKERFGDFYKGNEKEFEAMMEELEKKFNDPDGEWHKRMEEAMKRQEEAMERHQEAMERHREAEVHQKMAAIEHDKMATHMKKVEEEMARVGEKMKELEKNLKAFQEEVTVQLVKDGYLKKGEKIESMNWDDDGTIKINGKEIQEKDMAKYREIHKKHFKGEKGSFHFQE